MIIALFTISDRTRLCHICHDVIEWGEICVEHGSVLKMYYHERCYFDTKSNTLDAPMAQISLA